MENPFKVPEFLNIFELKDKNKENKIKKKDVLKKLKVHEKLNVNHQIKSRREALNEITDFKDEVKLKSKNISIILQKTKRQFIDRETRDQYIANRREMFFIEYSINVQRSEIARLEKLAALEEKKIEIAERCLEQDAALFDEFLKENDKSSVEAIANAEQESHKKSLMNDSIRELTAQKQKLNAEINRLKDIVKDYKLFKEFLEKLMPKEQRLERENRRKAKHLKKIKKRLDSYRSSLSKAPSPVSMSSETSAKKFVITRKSSLKPKLFSNRTSIDEEKLVQLEFNHDNCSSSEESDEEIYFTDGQELVTVLRDLEEANLRLFQLCQETDESNEVLRNQTNQLKQSYESDIDALMKHHAFLNKAINNEVQKTKDFSLDESELVFGGYNMKEKKAAQDDLHGLITKVYQSCIKQSDAQLSSIQMLYELETKLIFQLEQIQKLPEEKVKEAKQEKELELRQQLKDLKKKQQRLHQEERIQKALKRSQAEPKKQIGRRLVTRSKPPDVRKMNNKNSEVSARELEEYAFLFE